MKEKDKIVVTGLIILMIILWLGFAFHQSPRFAGSFWGGMLALSGSILMLVPLFYSLVKRIKPLRRWLEPIMPIRTLLSWHIYAGVLGPILVLLHTGHRFESALGISLTAMTLIVVFSGLAGRYLLSMIGKEIHEKQSMLKELQLEYIQVATEFQNDAKMASAVNEYNSFFPSIFTNTFSRTASASNHSSYKAIKLSESIADLEYAISTHNQFKKTFKKWLKLHITISVILYALLIAHIWASIYFGIRWFS